MDEGSSKYEILLTASDKTREAFESVKESTGSLTDKLDIMRVAFAATAVASAVAVAAMVKGSINAADEMSKAAQKVGTTTEMLSGLKYAAELSDVSFETLQKSLGKLSNNAFIAATQGGAAATAFTTLGVSVKGADGHLKDSGSLLSELADKFAAMPNSTEKTALAMHVFGKAGMEMIPMLNGGSEGLAKIQDALQKMGGVISTETGLRAEEFNDTLNAIKKSSESFANQAMSDLIPVLGVIAKSFEEASKDGTKLSVVSEEITNLVKLFAIAGANAAFVFKGLGTVLVGLKDEAIEVFTGDWIHGKSNFTAIAKQIKKDLDEASESVSAFEEHILLAQKVDVSPKSKSTLPGLNTEAVNKSLEALLAKSKQFSAELVISHESAFDKIVTKYVEMDAKLSKAGAAGTQQRKALAKSFEAFMVEEQSKRTAEITAAAEKETAVNNKLIDAQRDKFAKIKSQADQASLTGDQRENARYAAQLHELEKDRKVLEDKHLWDLQSEAKYQAAMAALKAEHQKKQMQSDIAAVNFGRAVKLGEYHAAMDLAAQMTAGIAGHSRAAFEINKAASTASAIINTFDAISGVMKIFPGPVGWGMAAAQAAIGFAQVDQIQSTDFGGGGANTGGGGVPSMATSPGIPVAPQESTPAAAAAVPVESTAAQAVRTINISMVGEAQLFTAQSIREQLIPALNEAAGDGVTINVLRV